MDYVENILILAKRQGITKKKICEILGKSSSYITDWQNGRSKPKADEIITLSQLFNVSIDYLLTGKEGEALTEEDERVLRLYKKLTVDKKQIVDVILDQAEEQEQIKPKEQIS